MIELWRMRRTLSLSSLPGPLWPEVVAPDRALSMGQIELNCTYAELFEIELFLHLTVIKNFTYTKLNCLN